MNVSNLFNVRKASGPSSTNAAAAVTADLKQIYQEAVTSHPFVNKSHYNTIIDTDGCVRDAKGNLVAALVKKALPKEVTSMASEVLRAAPARTSLRANIFGGEAPLSGIAGYYDYTGAPIEFKSRKTSFTCEWLDEWHKVFPLVTYASEIYRSVCPEEWEKQNAVIPDVVRINGTPFSTLTLNQRFRTAKHTDSGDFDDGYGVLAVLEGTFEGLHLGLPDFGACFRMQAGDVLIFNTHHFHCNTELEGDSRLWDRLTCVFYYRAMLGEPSSYAHYERRLAEALAAGKSVRFDYIQRKPNGVNLNRPAEVYAPMSSPFSLCASIHCGRRAIDVFHKLQDLINARDPEGKPIATKKIRALSSPILSGKSEDEGSADSGSQQNPSMKPFSSCFSNCPSSTTLTPLSQCNEQKETKTLPLLLTPAALFLELFGDKRIDAHGLPHRSEMYDEVTTMMDTILSTKRGGEGGLGAAPSSGGFSEALISPEVLEQQKNLLALNVLKAGLPENLYEMYNSSRTRWLEAVSCDWKAALTKIPNRTDFTWNNRGAISNSFFELCDVAAQVMLFLLGRDEATSNEKNAFWLTFAAHLHDSTIKELNMPPTAMSMKKLNVKLKDYEFGGTRYFEDQSPEEQQRRILRQQQAVKARRDYQQGEKEKDTNWLDNDSFDYQEEDVVVDYKALEIPEPEENPVLLRAKAIVAATNPILTNVQTEASKINSVEDEAEAVKAPARKKAVTEASKRTSAANRAGSGRADAGSVSTANTTIENGAAAALAADVRLLVVGPPKRSEGPILNENNENAGQKKEDITHSLAHSYSAIVSAMRSLYVDGGLQEGTAEGKDGTESENINKNKKNNVDTKLSSTGDDREDEDGPGDDDNPKVNRSSKTSKANSNGSTTTAKVQKDGAKRTNINTSTSDLCVNANATDAAKERMQHEARRFVELSPTLLLWYKAAMHRAVSMGLFNQRGSDAIMNTERAGHEDGANNEAAMGVTIDTDACAPVEGSSSPLANKKASGGKGKARGKGRGRGGVVSTSSSAAVTEENRDGATTKSAAAASVSAAAIDEGAGINWDLLGLWAAKMDEQQVTAQHSVESADKSGQPSAVVSSYSTVRENEDDDEARNYEPHPTRPPTVEAVFTPLDDGDVDNKDVCVAYGNTVHETNAFCSGNGSDAFDAVIGRNVLAHTPDSEVCSVVEKLFAKMRSADFTSSAGATAPSDEGCEEEVSDNNNNNDNVSSPTTGASPKKKAKGKASTTKGSINNNNNKKSGTDDKAAAATGGLQNESTQLRSSPSLSPRPLILVEPDAEDVSYYLLKKGVAVAWCGKSPQESSCSLLDASPVGEESDEPQQTATTSAVIPANQICLRFAEMLKRECGLFKFKNMTDFAFALGASYTQSTVGDDSCSFHTVRDCTGVFPYLRTRAQLKAILEAGGFAIRGQFNFKKSLTNSSAFIVTRRTTEADK